MDEEGGSGMTIKVAIAGARGRMGVEAFQAVQQAGDMEVVAVLDYKYEGLFLNHGEVNHGGEGAPIYTSFDALVRETAPHVLLDLTTPDAVFANMQQAIQHGVRPVVGTSGLQMGEIEQLTQFAKEREVGGVIAPNFSIGAVLAMKFSAYAARYLQDIEIIELHHNQKVDAPSGTAVKTAEMITEVREAHTQGHPDEKEQLEGARGADVEGMKIHSVRLPGLLAHQEVLLGGQGELLTLRHDSFNRSSFMPGILLAIRHVMNENQLIYGLEYLLD